MGYCYVSGEKHPRTGHWKFKRCDGRRKDYCGNTDLNRNCSSFCKSHKEAVQAVKDWEYLHTGYNKTKRVLSDIDTTALCSGGD